MFFTCGRTQWVGAAWQQPRLGPSKNLNSSTSGGPETFWLWVRVAFESSNSSLRDSWEMAVLMSQTLPALGVAVFSGPSLGPSGMVWWMRTQKSGFSCLSLPLAHRQCGAIWDFCFPRCGQAVFFSFPLPSRSPVFLLHFGFGIGAP